MMVLSFLSFIVKLPVRRLEWMHTHEVVNRFTHLLDVNDLDVLYVDTIPRRSRHVELERKLKSYVPFTKVNLFVTTE